MTTTGIRHGLSTAAIAGAMACLPLVGASAQQANFNEAKIVTIEVAENIYMLAGIGGNIGLSVGDDGAFVIDDQFGQLTDKIMATIKEKTDKPVEFVFNTHWHGDHTGGNENFGTMGATIVAHDNVRTRMSTDQIGYMSGNAIKASPPEALPTITFSDTTTIYRNGQQIDLIKVPNAHTDGDGIVVFREANVMHTGDIFLKNLYPFVDYGSGGSLAGMIDAVNIAIDMADDETKVIPGHGDLADKSDMVRYRDMLVTLRDRVAEGQASGKSIEELTAENPMADLEEQFGGTPFRNGKQVYQAIFKDERFDQ